jgi:hypothetical protein
MLVEVYDGDRVGEVRVDAVLNVENEIVKKIEGKLGKFLFDVL